MLFLTASGGTVSIHAPAQGATSGTSRNAS